MTPDRVDRLTAPPVASLHDWHVGMTKDGRYEVRIVLSDPAEARAWAAWMFERGDGVVGCPTWEAREANDG